MPPPPPPLTESSSSLLRKRGSHRQWLPMATQGRERGTGQYSSSLLESSWAFPSSLLPHVSHYMWGLFQLGSAPDQLHLVREYENVGTQEWGRAGGLRLEVGEVYVSAVQACLASPTPFCLSPVYSDGVQVLVRPIPTSVSALYQPLEWNAVLGTSNYGVLGIEWSPFQDSRMVYYEWAVGTGEPGHELLTEWEHVEWYVDQVTTPLNTSLSLHKNNTVTVRGYNAAGLHSTVWVELEWNIAGETLSRDQVPRSKLLVFDLPQDLVPDSTTADWRQLVYSEWDPVESELDYTSSAHSLSAAWPDLRYTEYAYSVSTTPTFRSCDSPDDVMCGSTIANSVIITNLDLQDGDRYYVCVRASQRHAIHPSPSTPHTLTACTNGITVDLSPPNGSCVELRPLTFDSDNEIGSGGVASGSGLDSLARLSRSCTGNASLFQASDSDLHVVWSSFQDLESYGDAVHAYGVAYYECAVGKLRK